MVGGPGGDDDEESNEDADHVDEWIIMKTTNLPPSSGPGGTEVCKQGKC